MRNLEINKRPLTALNYLGKVDVVDSDGYLTGEQTVSYSPEILIMGNVSGAKGSAEAEVFGTDIEYDKVIALEMFYFLKFNLDENTVFFIDKKPEYDKQGMPLYDYKVHRIAETPNQVSIAVKKVRR